MALDVDSVLRRINQFGLFQTRIIVLFMFILFPVTYQILIMVFVAYEPPWMCTEQSVACFESNSSSARNTIYSLASPNYYKRCFLNRSEWKFADYSLYEGPHQTIVTEFDLICDRHHLAWLSHSILFFTQIVGAIILGYVADRFGRKNVIFPSVLGVIVVSFAMAFVKSAWAFLLCRAIVGFFESGCLISMFILATELVGPEKRSLAGTVLWFFFGGALLVLALMAYFVRNWRTLLILSSAPYIVVLLFWKFIPESVRWLLVHDRKEEAREILQQVAKVNKREMPDDEIFVPVVTASKSALELFRTWKRTIFTLIQIYTWFVHGLVYFGLAMSSAEFGGSIYLNFVLSSLVEFIANFLAIDNTNRFGRKKTVVGYSIAAGMSTLGVAFIPAGTTNTGYIAGRVALGSLGKMLITTSYDAILIFATEIFPTVVRQSAMGVVYTASYIGAACAPFVIQLITINPTLPFVVMGVITFVAAILCWVLPETLGRRTAEIMEDTVMEAKRHQRAHFAQQQGQQGKGIANESCDMESNTNESYVKEYTNQSFAMESNINKLNAMESDINEPNNKESNTNESNTNELKTQEANINEPKAQEPNVHVLNAMGSNINELNAQESNTNELNAQESNTNALNAQESNTNALNAQESNTNELNAQESNTNELNAQESNTNALNAQESNTNELNAQESNTNELNAQESNTNALNAQELNINESYVNESCETRF